jgi:hypothetical protein
MLMTDDEFDLRLRQAIKPMVTEIIPLSVVQQADRSTWRRPAFGAAMPAALAFVIVVALAGGVALLRVSAPIGPGPSSSLLIGAAASHSALGSGASSPSPSPTMTIGCGIFPSEPDLCQQAVIVAEGRLPANQQPPLAVALRATQTMSICPPSVSYAPAHPETCAVVAHVTTKSGTVDMVLRLSPTGWMFEFFIK